MDIGEKIRLLRIRNHLTQEDLALAANTTKQTIHKYETGIISNIPASKVKAIADKLETTPAYLMGWENELNSAGFSLEKYGILPVKTKKIPMLGEIACGEPKYCNEEYETFIEASDHIDADFCLVAKGDSMINARIHNGDVVFIKKQSAVENGEIAAVIIDNEATLKRVYYYPDKNKLVLSAENPAYEPFIYTEEELNQIKILGKAIAFQSFVK